MTLVCTSAPDPEAEGMSLGCDVSGAQVPDRIDWAGAVADGVSWGMARVSWGSHIDGRGLAHLAAMRAAGLTVGAYHYANVNAGAAQVDQFLGQLKAAKIGAGDIAPCLDLEWIPGIEHRAELPHDKAGYCRIVDALIAACVREYGGVWIYSAPGFWQGVGAPESWNADGVEWWVPWYPRRPDGRLLEGEARGHKWPTRPGIPNPAAWQFDALQKPWSRCGEIDHNLARRLPILTEG